MLKLSVRYRVCYAALPHSVCMWGPHATMRAWHPGSRLVCLARTSARLFSRISGVRLPLEHKLAARTRIGGRG
eukprot:15473507-Alexandrium_andersonii.AAC.1